MPKLSWTGQNVIASKLERMARYAPREVKNAARRCGRIMAREIKAAIKSRTGLLAKSIGDKTKEGKGGKITTLAGPRRGFRTALVERAGRGKVTALREVKGKGGKITLKKITLAAAGGLAVVRGTKSKRAGTNNVIDPVRYAHLADAGHAKGAGKGAAEGQHFMARAQSRFAGPVFAELAAAFKSVKGA